MVQPAFVTLGFVNGLIGLTVGVIMAGIGFFIATKMRSAATVDSVARKKAQRETPLPLQLTGPQLANLQHAPALRRYDCLGSNNAQDLVVFVAPANFTSWGFYHRVHIQTDHQGQPNLSVQTMSVMIQYGPIVTKAHNQFIKALRHATQHAIEQNKARIEAEPTQ